MAYVYNLTDGTTTLSLNDLSNYVVAQGGIATPVPSRKTVTAGNIFRSGSDLLERQYTNRSVTIQIRILGSSQDDLISNITAIHGMLERAAEFTTRGLGSQVTLSCQWHNATNSYTFHVLDGTLQVAAGTARHAVALEVTGTLTLQCKPFAFGAEETMENYLNNPLYESDATDLGDWTTSVHANHTGTITRGGTHKFSFQGVNQSSACRLDITGASGAGTSEIHQTTDAASAAESDIFSLGVLMKATVKTGNISRFRIQLDWRNSSNVSISTAETDVTAVQSDYTLITVLNQTAPANTNRIRVTCQVTSSGATAAGRVDVTGWMLVKAASLPAAIMSGREIHNHMADTGHAAMNQLAIFNMPGDVPALMQLKLTEVEAHTKVWMGGMHASRINTLTRTTNFIEAEDFSGDGAFASVSDAGSSGAYYRRWNDATTGMSDDPASPDVLVTSAIANFPHGTYRILTRAKYVTAAASMGMGYAYGDIALTPAVAADYTALTATWGIHDLGSFTFPPVITPDGLSDGTVIFRMGIYRTGGSTAEIHVDWVMLLPIDFGSSYCSKTSATDVVLFDSRSPFKGITLLNTSDVVQSVPADQLGTPLEIHPEGSRFFFAFDEGTAAAIALSGKAAVTYLPRYLYVRGND